MNLTHAAIIALLAATLLIASPFYIWPMYGETPYYVVATPTDAEPDGNNVIEFKSLPAEGQEAFDNPVPNHSHPIYENKNSETIEMISENKYVRAEGQLYQVSLEHGDGAWLYVSLLRYGMLGSGVLLGVGAMYILARRKL